MVRSPWGNDIITLRFFDFRNSRKFRNFFNIRQRASMLCFPVVFGVLFGPKSVNRKSSPCELKSFHFFAKVTKHYACAAHFRSKWGGMAEKCTFCGKVRFRAIWGPGRGQIRGARPLLLAPGAGWAHFS